MSLLNIIITDDSFLKKVVRCPVPSVAFFAVEWSGHCHMVEPIVTKLAVRFQRRVRFYRVDAEMTREIVKTYGIKEFPTFLFFSQGIARARVEGLASERDLFEQIENLL